MNICINGQTGDFPGRTLAELIELHRPASPFAVALNTEFVPRSAYAHTLLKDGDRVDIVRPVVGG
ncbi:MAG: sulfur carrier protein ThiS [Eikenella sp.]|nr:sulfur carrier protein ThiS [Eikenella sp.]